MLWQEGSARGNQPALCAAAMPLVSSPLLATPWMLCRHRCQPSHTLNQSWRQHPACTPPHCQVSLFMEQWQSVFIVAHGPCPVSLLLCIIFVIGLDLGDHLSLFSVPGKRGISISSVQKCSTYGNLVQDGSSSFSMEKVEFFVPLFLARGYSTTLHNCW
jgi:hypothetical protein